MKRVKLLLAAHCHQPIGNFGFVLEENFRKAYRPFAEALVRHPRVKVALHYSGPLLEFFQAEHPEFIKLLRELAARGQVEFWTAGFYEPILSAIPPDDAVGQVRMMSQAIAEIFGVAPPAGIWITERVWEPQLPSLVRRVAGVQFTALDDGQFLAAGLAEEELRGPFVTEDLGWPLSVFPISRELRYRVPFKPVREVIEHLRGMATEDGHAAAVLADDGEKFGGWPETHDWVYRRGWLESFFEAIEENGEWLSTSGYASFLADHPARGRVYIPSGSYEELEEWALPPPRQRELAALRAGSPGRSGFVRGGTWRGFLARYPEADRLHKKMLWVSRKVARARGTAAADAADPMVRDLWKGQCNCAYWHGIFGGLYLNYLRHAVYRHLILAEAAADRTRAGGGAFAEVLVGDWDADGVQELVFESDLLCAVADPHKSGGVVELDWRPTGMNLADTMTRREEAYHDRLRELRDAAGAGGEGVASIHERVRTKEPGLEHRLVYDKWIRASGLVHLLSAEADAEAFRRGEGTAGPLRLPDRESPHAERKGGGGTALAAGTWTAGAVRIRWELERGPEEKCALRLHCTSDGPLPVGLDRVAVEWNVSLLAGQAADRYFLIGEEKADPPHLAGTGETGEIAQLSAVDEWQGIRCVYDLSPPARTWRFPIESVSLSEDGFERVFQQSCLVFLWPAAALASGGCRVSFSVRPLPR